ncbi:MAG: HlyC/CorC family transporter [Hyphomicrobiaceae bacterium]
METDITTWITGGAIFALLAISAFFSGSETALTAASRARMHTLEQEGSRPAKSVNVLLGGRERLIGALLLGNNFVNILASALATGFLIDLFGDSGVIIATAAMTVLILIFGEVLPKTYAINFPNRTSLAVAPVLRVLVAVLSPVTAAVQWMVQRVFALFGIRTDGVPDEDFAHQEIRGAIDLHHKEGTVVKGDRDMLGGILDLKELEVADVMVHRLKMETVSADDPPEKVVESALASPHTRLPVWKNDPDNIIGILHVKDLLRDLGRRSWDASGVDIEALATPTWFVPDTTPLKSQLGQFLKRNSHLALVVDEYGEVQGLVTLEDILEEIVGQISDEFDRSEALIRPQADGRVIVDGSVPIRDLNRHMDWALPDDEATTIAGLVIHEAQTIPDSGRAYTFHGYRFEVLRKSRNRVTALRIERLPKPAADGDGG